MGGSVFWKKAVTFEIYSFVYCNEVGDNFLTLMLLLLGQNYQEDCAEAAMPGLQTCITAPNQGQLLF